MFRKKEKNQLSHTQKKGFISVFFIVAHTIDDRFNSNLIEINLLPVNAKNFSPFLVKEKRR
jgi:hypothetical protein